MYSFFNITKKHVCTYIKITKNLEFKTLYIQKKSILQNEYIFKKNKYLMLKGPPGVYINERLFKDLKFFNYKISSNVNRLNYDRLNYKPIF